MEEKKDAKKNERWVTIDEALELTNKTRNCLYVSHHYDKKHGYTNRFKKVGNTLYVNMTEIEKSKSGTRIGNGLTQETQEEFEKLYWKLKEYFPTDWRLAGMLSPFMGKTTKTINRYLWKQFTTGSESMKRTYIKAMRELLGKVEGEG